jgi:hypothetical protein
MGSQSAMVEPDATNVSHEEISPSYGWRSYWSTVLLLQFIALLLACPLVLTATWPKAGPAAVGFLSAAVCTFPFCLIFGWTHQSYLRKKAVRIWCQNGQVNCIADSNVHTAELRRCRWFYGDQTQATHPPREQWFSGGGSALLIEFPAECRTEEREWSGRRYPAGPVVVAVGFRGDTRTSWERLLLESGAVHDADREALPAPLSGQITACLTLLAFPASWFAGLYGSRAIDDLLVAMGVPRDIASPIGFPLFFPGCVYLLAYVALHLSLYERRCAFTDEQREAAVEGWRSNARWIGVLALVVFGIWISNGFALTWKLIVTTVNLLMTGLTILYVHYLLKDSQGVSTG